MRPLRASTVNNTSLQKRLSKSGYLSDGEACACIAIVERFLCWHAVMAGTQILIESVSFRVCVGPGGRYRGEL